MIDWFLNLYFGHWLSTSTTDTIFVGKVTILFLTGLFSQAICMYIYVFVYCMYIVYILWLLFVFLQFQHLSFQELNKIIEILNLCSNILFQFRLFATQIYFIKYWKLKHTYSCFYSNYDKVWIIELNAVMEDIQFCDNEFI